MKTLILYGSKYGSAKTCAEKLAAGLDGPVTIADAKQSPPAPDEFGRVVIGSSVYAGTMRKEVLLYCKRHIEVLQYKKVALFVVSSGMDGGGEEYLRANLPTLMQQADIIGGFGGEFKFDKMNFMEKALIKQIAKRNAGPAPSINEEAIQKFAESLNMQ